MAIWPPEMIKMAAKPSPLLLQKHSRGGCVIDKPVELPSAGERIFLLCDALLHV